jgi:hypothetical protein
MLLGALWPRARGELIAHAFEVEPDHFVEYRLAASAISSTSAASAFDAAYRRYTADPSRMSVTRAKRQ